MNQENNFNKGDKVRHYGNKQIYEIVEFGKLQWFNIWYECVIYKNDKEFFVRTLQEFINSFFKID